MGSEEFYPEEWPVRQVEIAGLWIDTHPVTVAEFRLLLSPDVIDFAQPVQVTVNGKVVFSGRIRKDLATLQKWTAADDDRTMLYGAELAVTAP